VFWQLVGWFLRPKHYIRMAAWFNLVSLLAILWSLYAPPVS
jgi:hypothetical protein